LKIDRDAHRAWVDESEIGLTALEFRLLHAFMSRKGRVQTRDALLSDVWGIEAEVTTRTVDTHVKRLREKLGDAGMYIETLRGVGYRFKDQPDEVEA
jgi:two-component system phosphate regulon response regulator PhoB